MNLRCITLLLLMVVALQSIAAKDLYKRSKRRIQNYSNGGRFLTGLFNKFNGGQGGNGGNKQKGNNVPITIITTFGTPTKTSHTPLTTSPISSLSPTSSATGHTGILPPTLPCCKPTRPRPHPPVLFPPTVTSTFNSVPPVINTNTVTLPPLSSSASDPLVINPVPLPQPIAGSGILSPVSSGPFTGPLRSLKEDGDDESEARESQLLNNADDSSINVNIDAEEHDNFDDKHEGLNKIEEGRANTSIRRKQLMRRRRTQTTKRRNQNNVKKYTNKLKHRNIMLQFQLQKPLQNSNVAYHDQQWLMEMRWRRHQQLLRRKRQMLMQRRRKQMKQKRRLMIMKKRRRLQILKWRQKQGNRPIIIHTLKK